MQFADWRLNHSARQITDQNGNAIYRDQRNVGDAVRIANRERTLDDFAGTGRIRTDKQARLVNLRLCRR